ncbi:CMRF35-like molecule 5 [Ambystoma mexicanum]|uniref:CMRF35-like molecule 5 n=1 Tax=Ambystoma mexicanum TaxID=8296 RepID=UPI0037E76BDF
MRGETALACDCQNGSTDSGLFGGSVGEGNAHFIQPSRMRSVTVWVLVLLPGVCGAAGRSAQVVSGTVGGSLTAHCKYSQYSKGNNHYWCKQVLGFSCAKAIESKGSRREVKQGRYSIKDNPATLTFTVTMRGLRKNDSGLYWCVSKVLGHDKKEEVKVTVLSSATKKPSTNKSLTNMILPAAPSASSITSMSHPEERNPTPYTITALSLPGEATTEVHSTTVDASEDPASSPAPGTLLQSLAPAALLALIPLAAIGACERRKRNKSLDGAGGQSDGDTSLPDLPSKHIMENPQYVTVGNPAAGGRNTVYSMVERGPASATSDPGGLKA